MANTSYLALLVGAHLTGYLRQQRASLPAEIAENTAQLGLGALLHDVGKLNMPDDLRDASIFDAKSEWPEYRYHVRCGYEAVREHISPIAANIVLHHHERFDGSGFPGRENASESMSSELAGTKIHVFSRIVAVVDAFDHLLCSQGQPRPTIAAIRGIRDKRLSGWFDPVIVETLLRLVPPFMNGSLVTLSNGQRAAVVANHPEAPCKPTVRIVPGEGHDPIEHATSRTLDLRMCRELCVAKVGEVDVRRYLFDGEMEPGSKAA